MIGKVKRTAISTLASLYCNYLPGCSQRTIRIDRILMACRGISNAHAFVQLPVTVDKITRGNDTYLPGANPNHGLRCVLTRCLIVFVFGRCCK